MAKIEWTQASRKRGIGRRHVLHVMSTVTPTVGVRPSGESELTWIGPTEDEWLLEVIAVVLDDGDTMLVIHVMPIY